MISTLSKVCGKCKKDKPSTDFARRARSKDGLNNWCKLCAREYRIENREKLTERQRAYRAENIEKVREWDRLNQRRKTLKKYGLTLEEYDKLVTQQAGECAICEEHPGEGSNLYVDHDHDTGKVRGLLCQLCNSGLGHFRDDPKLLEAALEYIS